VAVAKLGADVLALEMVAERRDFTLAEAKKAGVTLRSEALLPAQDRGQFDFVLSLDAMEHYSDPAFILKEMHLALRPGGRLLLSFGPPWYSPYGAHLRFMSPVPWIHLFFSENALMEERRRFRSDGAKKFSEVEGGMNQMTVGRFERMLGSSGFSIERKKMKCVYRMNFLGWIPLVRELFVNEVSVVAVKRS
jgi:SAM-dependent methyltransferase